MKLRDRLGFTDVIYASEKSYTFRINNRNLMGILSVISNLYNYHIDQNN
jgi:hypothetical protein